MINLWYILFCLMILPGCSTNFFSKARKVVDEVEDVAKEVDDVVDSVEDLVEEDL